MLVTEQEKAIQICLSVPMYTQIYGSTYVLVCVVEQVSINLSINIVDENKIKFMKINEMSTEIRKVLERIKYTEKKANKPMGLC